MSFANTIERIAYPRPEAMMGGFGAYKGTDGFHGRGLGMVWPALALLTRVTPGALHGNHFVFMHEQA